MKKPNWEKILCGRKFICHIDNVEAKIRLSVKGESKGPRPLLPVIKNLHDPVSHAPHIPITARTKYGAVYQQWDEKTRSSIKIQGSYLTIALAREWPAYDLSPTNYHQKLVNVLTVLLSTGVLVFGTGKSFRHSAYYILSKRANINVEHAIDMPGVETGDYKLCNKIGKWYQRNEFSRLEVVPSFRYTDIKPALKQRLSMSMIDMMGKDALIKKHIKNIIEKMPPYDIEWVFGVTVGADRKYLSAKLKPVLGDIITAFDVGTFPAETQRDLKGYSHQNII